MRPVNRRKMHRALLALALTATLAISGCAPATAPLDSAAATRLEQTVLAITEAVAATDWSAAERDLAVLEGQLDAALAAGELTAERAAEIRAAIALVRADVAAALDQPAQTPSPEPSPTEESEKPGNRGGNSDKNDKDDD